MADQASLWKSLKLGSDGPPFKTYCPKTARAMEKLDLKETLTRDEMVGVMTDMADTSVEIDVMLKLLKHSVKCPKPRCITGFCFSFKLILKHYAECIHPDCLECNKFNMVVFEHAVFCDDPRTCKVPGCLSISRRNEKIPWPPLDPCFSGEGIAKKKTALSKQEIMKPGTSGGFDHFVTVAMEPEQQETSF